MTRAPRSARGNLRANRGGRQRGAQLVDQLTDPEAVRSLVERRLAEPMPDDTFEAIMTGIGRRSTRGTPGYMKPRRRPKRSAAATAYSRLYSRIEQRALRELQRRHREEYRELVRQHWATYERDANAGVSH